MQCVRVWLWNYNKYFNYFTSIHFCCETNLLRLYTSTAYGKKKQNKVIRKQLRLLDHILKSFRFKVWVFLTLNPQPNCAGRTLGITRPARCT